MSGYVLDASVAAKWLLPAHQEPLSDAAGRLLESFVRGATLLDVPDLFWPETANILWKAVRRGRIKVARAAAGLAWLQELGLRTVPAGPLLADGLKIAAEFDRTVSDSLYIALAVQSRRPFLTADEKLLHAVAARFPVCWLGSLP